LGHEIINPSFRGVRSTNPESRDSGSGPEPVIGRRKAPTRWDHPGMTIKINIIVSAGAGFSPYSQAHDQPNCPARMLAP
jgi:hypothetical protein